MIVHGPLTPAEQCDPCCLTEDPLGVMLLRRITRSVVPTAAGADLLASLEPGLRQIQDAVE